MTLNRMLETYKSWIEIHPCSEFSLNNIPFGVFSHKNDLASAKRCGTAIGDNVVDLSLLYEHGLINFHSMDSILCDRNIFAEPSLNSFMELPKIAWQSIRHQLIKLFILNEDSDDRLKNNATLQNLAILPFSAVTMHLPAIIGDYTDFYSSKEHAENVGSIFRGKNSITGSCLQPNWLHLPVGYHGRSSTVVVSGTDCRRPRGQVLLPQSDPHLPQLLPCQALDFELELGCFIGGPSNELGEVRKGRAFSLQRRSLYIPTSSNSPSSFPFSLNLVDSPSNFRRSRWTEWQSASSAWCCSMVGSSSLSSRAVPTTIPPDARLVGEGRPAVGVRAAGPIHGEELPDIHQSVDRHDGRPGALPLLSLCRTPPGARATRLLARPDLPAGGVRFESAG